MNWEFRKCFALSFLLIVNTTGFAGTPSGKAAEPPLSITVWVYNYAEIPAEPLTRAKSEATRLFRQAGVGMTWVDCPRSLEELPKYPACQGLPVSTRLVLRIHPRSLAYRANGHSTVFGQALLPDDGSFGMQAAVYAYGDDGEESRRAVMLGHLMAHEVGHLLMGTETHSSVGVMQANWSPRDLRYIAEKRLLFSRRDAKRIRAQVRERRRAEIARK